MLTRLATFTLIGLLFATPFLLLVVQWKLFSRARRINKADRMYGVPTCVLLIGVSALAFPLAEIVFAFAWTLYGDLIYASFAIFLEASIGIAAGILSTVVWRLRSN
jgi:hypothetical protein